MLKYKCRWFSPLSSKTIQQFGSHMQEILTTEHPGIVNGRKFVFPFILWTLYITTNFFFLTLKRKKKHHFLSVLLLEQLKVLFSWKILLLPTCFCCGVFCSLAFTCSFIPISALLSICKFNLWESVIPSHENYTKIQIILLSAYMRG